MNLARLNHVLVPTTAEERARVRQTRIGRCLWPLFDLALSATTRGQILALLVLLVGVPGLEIRGAQTYWVWCLLAGCLVGSVSMRRKSRLHGVTVSVVATRRVAVRAPVVFRIAVHNTTKATHEQVRVSGPFLPWDGSWVGGARGIGALRPGEIKYVECTASFKERGEHHLDPFCAATLAPMGLFLGPPAESETLRLMVHPRIAAVQSLSWRTPKCEPARPGNPAAGRAQGSELLGVRPYRQGDPVRMLHARSSARVGKAMVMEYAREAVRRFGIWIDLGTPASAVREFEAALSLAAGIAAIADHGQGRLAWIALGNEGHRIPDEEDPLSRTLDILGRARRGRQGFASRADAALREEMGGLSGMVLVLTAWDPSRTEFERWIRMSGIPCKTIIVGSDPPSPQRANPERLHISVAQILAEVPLCL